jgi:uncharacterized protein (TIGR03083 family)
MTDTSPSDLAGAERTAVLIDAWAGAMGDLREVVASLGAEGWRQPSLLPGWSVADIVAHLSWIERILLSRFDPPHEPDWAALPHVANDLSRATEVPVDLRRARSRDEVLAEFDTTIADRHAALLSGPQDPATPATNPFGKRVTLEAVLRMRTFDTWVHGQDIRLAVGRPGATGTSGARVAAEQIAGALGYVWAKRVDAPVGSSVLLEVVPPGIALRRAARRAEDGAGLEIAAPADPSVTLTMAFDDLVQLGCGRTRPDSSIEQARARVRVDGDQALGARAVERFNIAP